MLVQHLQKGHIRPRWLDHDDIQEELLKLLLQPALSRGRQRSTQRSDVGGRRAARIAQ